VVGVVVIIEDLVEEVVAMVEVTVEVVEAVEAVEMMVRIKSYSVLSLLKKEEAEALIDLSMSLFRIQFISVFCCIRCSS
jgi:hypothetical protein